MQQHIDISARARASALRRRARLAGATLAVLGLLASAGCGSSSSDNKSGGGGGGSSTTNSAASGGVATAKQMVTDALGEPSWNGPEESIDVSSLRGKTIWAINLDLSIPHLNTISKSLAEAAAAAGVKVVTFDGKSSVSEWARGVQQATAAHAAAIIPIAVNFDTIKAPLEQAKEAGIPIVAGLYTDADAPIPASLSSILSGQVTEQYVDAGKLEAAWAVQDSGGKAHVLAIDAPGISVSEPITQGVDEVLQQTCPDCKVTWKHSPTSQWSTQLGTQVRSALTSDPSIDYVVPVFDGMATFIVPAVHQAGAADRVKVSTFNATDAILTMLSKNDVVGADSGTQGPWEGWALADAAFRAILGKPAVDNYKIPLRLFTGDNVGDIDISKGEGAWYGPLDFAGKFRALWGLE